MVLETLVLGSLMATAYQSKTSQTDSTPHHTSIGERTGPYGIAVSQDMLCPASLSRNLKIKKHSAKSCHLKNKLHYGDMLLVEGIGLKHVNDCMNKRHKKSIDIWVNSYAEEKAIKPAKRAVIRVRGR